MQEELKLDLKNVDELTIKNGQLSIRYKNEIDTSKYDIGDLVTWTSKMGYQYIGIFNGWGASGKLKYKKAYCYNNYRIFERAGHIEVYKENIRLSNKAEAEIFYNYEKRSL